MSSPFRWLTWQPKPAIPKTAPAAKPAKTAKPPVAAPEAEFAVTAEPAKPAELPAIGDVAVTAGPGASFNSRGERDVIDADGIPCFFSTAFRGGFPEPVRIRTVNYRDAIEPTRLSIVQHRVQSANRFGQHASEFPYCALNIAEWRKHSFDLRRAHWFRSHEEIRLAAEGKTCSTASATPTESGSRAEFTGGRIVEIRPASKSQSRWSIWVANGGRAVRRRDFCTPHFDHAKRTAEHWYGPPLDGWHPIEGGRP